MKNYLLRNPKLLLTTILTLVIYIWINNIINPIFKEAHNPIQLFASLGQLHEGIYLILIKPLFVYIAGLIAINKI
jgi:hypothetical protein